MKGYDRKDNQYNMKRHSTHTHRGLIASLMILVSLAATAQIPEGYYDGLKGKSGAQLKDAIHGIIKNAKVLSYGSGTNKTWGGFYETDRLENNQCVDRYSPEVRYFSSKGSVPSGMNIEHSFPKSWWGGTENQAYKDLYNLMPSDSKANSAKSNYPMGAVTGTASYDNGVVKIGSCSEGFKVWEPVAKWKGDFARGYMYMATAYQNFTWSGNVSPQILQQGNYPTLKKWAYTLYLKWARTDKVDEMEIKRNDAVCKIQGNRNPFVDFPNLMEYVWGDSINTPFNPETTLKSTDYTGGTGGGNTGGDVGGDTGSTVTVFSQLFTQTSGDFTASEILSPSADFEVWTRSNQYGWVGTGYYNNKSYATEAVLKSPVFDLTSYDNASMEFSHALNYLRDNTLSDCVSVEVLCEGQTAVLTDITWPSGSNWNFVNSGTISLDEFAGSEINIVFRYKSTAQSSTTWEIQKLTVSGSKGTAAVEETIAPKTDAFDASKPFTMHTIDGRRTVPSQAHGIVIIRQNGKVFKTMVR